MEAIPMLKTAFYVGLAAWGTLLWFALIVLFFVNPDLLLSTSQLPITVLGCAYYTAYPAAFVFMLMILLH
jgi:hypothetical protein